MGLVLSARLRAVDVMPITLEALLDRVEVRRSAERDDRLTFAEGGREE
jgi:hypothetical protein